MLLSLSDVTTLANLEGSLVVRRVLGICWQGWPACCNGEELGRRHRLFKFEN